MAEDGENFEPSMGDFINQKAPMTPKVDGIIIYILAKWATLCSTPYKSSQERRYKYLAMRDAICTGIDPLLVPKITDKAWAKRYFEVMRKLKKPGISDGNLDYFQDVLQEAMQLFTTILYSNGYYELRIITDKDYTRWLAEEEKNGNP